MEHPSPWGLGREPGVIPAQAGIHPPWSVVSLSDHDRGGRGEGGTLPYPNRADASARSFGDSIDFQ